MFRNDKLEGRIACGEWASVKMHVGYRDGANQTKLYRATKTHNAVGNSAWTLDIEGASLLERCQYFCPSSGEIMLKLYQSKSDVWLTVHRNSV